MSDATAVFPTLSFLRALFEGAEGWIEFRLISNDGRRGQHFIPVAELEGRWPEIEKRLEGYNRLGANIYFGVNARTAEVGDAAHVKECRVLWADIDTKDAGILTANYAVLKGFKIEPSYIVDTGHGFHFYWLLKEPTSPADAEKIMREIARVLGGDHTYDAPRILRLPNTTNVKAAPVPCFIRGAFPVRRYNPMDFDPLQTAAAGVQPKKAAALAPPVHIESPLVQHEGNGHPFAYAMARAIAPFWRDGIRHKLSMAVAGLLRREDVKEEDALLIVKKTVELARDPEADDRLRAVVATYKEPLERIAGSTAIMALLGDALSKPFFDAFNKAASAIPPPPITRQKFPEFKLYDFLPSGGIFDQYIMYAANQTDSPLQYHLAAILTVTAAALGNRVCIPRFHGKKLYANLYTLLIGASSRFRKSTSIKLAKTVAKAAKVPAYPNNATVEALYARMATEPIEWIDKKTGAPTDKNNPNAKPVAWEGRPWGAIYHPEFENFLTASTKSYMADARSLYMDFYDGMIDRDSGSRDTKTQGRYYIEDPAISLLCGVTPASMRTYLTRTEFQNGLLARFLVILPPENHANDYGLRDEDPKDLDLFGAVASRIETLALCSGTLKVSKGAERIYADFERYLGGKVKEFEGTPRIQLDPFLIRLSTMAVKVAMCHEAVSSFPCLEVTEESMQYAVNLMTWAAAVLEPFFDVVRPDGDNRELRFRNQVLEILRGMTRKFSNGHVASVPHKMFLQHSNLDAEQFRRAVDSLIEEGRVIRGKTSNGRGMNYTLNETEK
jgi:hypothetical protein